MKNKTIFVTFFLMYFCLSVVSTFAAGAEQANPQKDATLVGTGDAKGTYSVMFNDLKPYCNNVEEFKESKSGSESVDFLVNRSIDAAIVQADVMSYKDRTEELVSKKLRALASLHINSLHIIVLRDGVAVKGENLWNKGSVVIIENLRQLANKPVAVFGSSEYTAIFVNERLKLNLITEKVDKYEEGLELVKAGKVFALLAMGGKPIPWVGKLDGKIFTLANMESGDIAAMQKPYKNIQVTYPNLKIVGANTLSVNNDIIVWDYQSGKQAAKLLAFKKCLEDNLQDIKDTRGTHPSWQQVELENLDNVSWQPYVPKSINTESQTVPANTAAKQPKK